MTLFWERTHFIRASALWGMKLQLARFSASSSHWAFDSLPNIFSVSVGNLKQRSQRMEKKHPLFLTWFHESTVGWIEAFALRWLAPYDLLLMTMCLGVTKVIAANWLYFSNCGVQNNVWRLLERVLGVNVRSQTGACRTKKLSGNHLPNMCSWSHSPIKTQECCWSARFTACWTASVFPYVAAPAQTGHPDGVGSLTTGASRPFSLLLLQTV